MMMMMMLMVIKGEMFEGLAFACQCFIAAATDNQDDVDDFVVMTGTDGCWFDHTSIVASYGFITPVSLYPMGLLYQSRCILWVYHTSIPSSVCDVLSRHRVIDIMCDMLQATKRQYVKLPLSYFCAYVRSVHVRR